MDSSDKVMAILFGGFIGLIALGMLLDAAVKIFG